MTRPASKTGLHDESVTLDNVEWAHPFFNVLVRGCDRADALFQVSLAQLSRCFGEAAVACQLAPRQPRLFSLRHGEASEDFLRRRRTLQ